MRIRIDNAVVVNEGRSFRGSVTIEDTLILDVEELAEGQLSRHDADCRIDADGCLLIPGVIDDHVHFREPGLTDKADIESESRAAAAGGVTTYFDMPNTIPQTTTIEALEEKFALAAGKSHVNYSFFFGATNDNTHLFPLLDVHRIPGVKLFMGSSTGNMLVDKREALENIFCQSPVLLMAHCEDTAVINRNMDQAKAQYGDDPSVEYHYRIRSEEACYESTALAVSLAEKTGAHLHVAHLTTARELQLFRPNDARITAEVVVGHLLFTHDDHATLGTAIKVNPSVKTRQDRDALRRALSDGRITVVGTDHAPHLPVQKEGGCAKAASGMPMIQFSLPAMLELVDEGVVSLERMVELMCHQPARLFEVRGRGFIRRGYKADLVLLRRGTPWVVSKDRILSKCGWSPLEGHVFNWHVERTFCNGHPVYADGRVDDGYTGEEVLFR